MGEGNDGKQHHFYPLAFLGANLGFAFWYYDREDKEGDRSNLGIFMAADARSRMLD